MTRVLLIAGAWALASHVLPAAAQGTAFDGMWAATVSCSPEADAAGYTLRFPVRIMNGALSGENGTKGAPSYLLLEGRIQLDGSSVLEASGLVGQPRYALKHVPQLTPYHYTASVQFRANQGSGTRAGGRPCTLAFSKSS
jgi:hypothetical protein